MVRKENLMCKEVKRVRTWEILNVYRIDRAYLPQRQQFPEAVNELPNLPNPTLIIIHYSFTAP